MADINEASVAAFEYCREFDVVKVSLRNGCEEIQKLYEREQKWIKDFVRIDSKVVGSSAEKGVRSRKKTLARTLITIPNVAYEDVFKEWDDRVVRATTTAASLDATQASGDRPMCQEAMAGFIPQTRSERASKHFPMIHISLGGYQLNTASIDVSVAGPSNVSTTDPSISTAGDIFKDEMMTIIDTLVAIRSTRPRTTSVIIHDVEEEPRKSTPAPTAQPSSKDKGKALMVEPKNSSKNPIKAQIQMDEELAIRLHEEEKADNGNRQEKESCTQEKEGI
ncbi:hypothetical protein Tco_0377062 [Tanacetum coccineum]